MSPSVCPLQATRNGSDLWLSHWVSSTAPHSAAQQQLQQQQPQQQQVWLYGPAATSAASLWCSGSSGGAARGVPLPACAPGAAGASRSHHSHHHHHTGGSGGGGGGGGRPLVDPSVRFYLTVLLIIAGANSAVTLVRAFSFAKGGLVAAQASQAMRSGQRARQWRLPTLRCQPVQNLFTLPQCCVLSPHAGPPYLPARMPPYLQRVHEQLLSAVLALPLAFFDATPPGRVLNRFSSDIGELV